MVKLEGRIKEQRLKWNRPHRGHNSETMPPTTVGPSWSFLCWNLTDGGRSAVLEGDNSRAPVVLWPPVNVTGADADDGTQLDDRDRHALLYIVVVLLFYSTGIVVAIVTYLKRERAEIEEEKAYDDYASFRNDPDRWARYFRVQRMIAQLDRVEREAAEKRRKDAEMAGESHPPARLFGARKSPRRADRPTSASSALKVLVFGSGSGPIDVDPSPLLQTGRGSDLKCSRSADGRLNVCGSKGLTVSPTTEGLSRTHSCDESSGRTLRVEAPGLKRSPRSTTTLQVHRV